jgi:hypothetical protein
VSPCEICSSFRKTVSHRGTKAQSDLQNNYNQIAKQLPGLRSLCFWALRTFGRGIINSYTSSVVTVNTLSGIFSEVFSSGAAAAKERPGKPAGISRAGLINASRVKHQPDVRSTLSAENPVFLVDLLVMNTATIQPAQRLNLLHLLAVGVALPACLATANHLLLTSSNLGDLSVPLLCVLMGFYVLQIGFISWAVANYIQPWPLRWFIYGWIMVLVDLQLSTMISNGGQNSQGVTCLATAVLAGQLGVIIVWGILGSGHIAWRIPALLVVLNQSWVFFNLLVSLTKHRPGDFTPGWEGLLTTQEGLLTTQAVLLVILCGILRLRGYSLVKLAAESDGASVGDKTKVPLQFGIRDVMVWTTSLAVLLAIAKAGDLLTMNFVKHVYDPGALLLFTIGTSTAVVLLVALWSALGQGSALRRYLVLSALSLSLGLAIAWYCTAMAKSTATRAWRYSYWHLYANGYWWIGWMFLTGVLLAASLIIYRTLGYRLVRNVKRPRGPTAAVAVLPVES